MAATSNCYIILTRRFAPRLVLRSSQRAGGNLERACEDAVASGEISWDEVARIFEEVGATIEHAFDEASQEPKVSERKQQLEQASQVSTRPRSHIN